MSRWRSGCAARPGANRRFLWWRWRSPQPHEFEAHWASRVHDDYRVTSVCRHCKQRKTEYLYMGDLIERDIPTPSKQWVNGEEYVRGKSRSEAREEGKNE